MCYQKHAMRPHPAKPIQHVGFLERKCWISKFEENIQKEAEICRNGVLYLGGESFLENKRKNKLNKYYFFLVASNTFRASWFESCACDIDSVAKLVFLSDGLVRFCHEEIKW